MTETTATENVNTPEALLQEQRAAIISRVRSDVDDLAGQGTMQDLLTLQQILTTATITGNILTGIADALGRHDHSDAVWVRLQDYDRVSAYAAQLEAPTKDAVWVDPDLFDAVHAFAEKLEEDEIETAEWNERWALIARVMDLPRIDLRDIGWALDAIEEDRGSGTPEEEFVTQILRLYGTRHLDSTRLTQAIQTLGTDLEYAAQDAAHFAKRFPDGYRPEDNQWPTLATEEVAAHA